MSSKATLPNYVALAKNVRGIFTFDLANEPPPDLKTWLARIHRYRNVGIPPNIADHTELDLSAKTFKRLPYPIPELEHLVDRLSEEVPHWVIESLVLSSAYIAPLFVHRPALSAFEPTSVWQLRISERPSEEQIKRHMRIVGYGMLDFHRQFTDAALETIREDRVNEEKERRKTACTEDGHERFWRLIEEAPPEATDGEWVGGYCDILDLLDEGAANAIRNTADLSVALGAVGVFIVEDPPA